MLSRMFRLGTTVVVLGLMTVSASAQGPGGGVAADLGRPRIRTARNCD